MAYKHTLEIREVGLGSRPAEDSNVALGTSARRSLSKEDVLNTLDLPSEKSDK